MMNHHTVLRIGFLAFSIVVLALVVSAQTTNTVPTASDEEMQWFRDAKFGLFIHWGPVSLKGTEIGWSRGGERKFPKGKGQIPVEIYDNLYKQFNPVEFNADEWVAIAKAAGMKYLVFTTKHHDGFSMFDSQLTDYKITNSPFKRDVTAELAEACHKAGIRLGFYHSPPDWRHPDYFTDNHERYVKYLHGQVRELCTNYGQVDILWFDGLGAKPEIWKSPDLIPIIRKLQPGILINNRTGLPQDFDTPEQRVGHFQNERAWESCITICRQWAWKPNDRMKTLKECLDILIRSVGGDGNLLFNVGPMPNGEIEPRQVERLKEMGAWMKQYGETIYKTRGGPYKTGSWGASTYRGNTIYLHVLDWDGLETLHMPALEAKILSSNVLTGGKAAIKQTAQSVEITLPARNHHAIDTIVALQLDGPAKAIPAQTVSLFQSLATGKKASASNVYQKNDWAFGPAKAFDDDTSTRWATDSGLDETWLAVDLGKVETYNRATIREAYNRVRRFELQSRNDLSGWKTFYTGKTIGEKLKVEFKPVTARCVRLKILETTDGPTIFEFQLFNKK